VVKSFDVHVTIISKFALVVEAENAVEASQVAGVRLNDEAPHSVDVQTQTFERKGS
jgi:hypothetical protein